MHYSRRRHRRQKNQLQIRTDQPDKIYFGNVRNPQQPVERRTVGIEPGSGLTPEIGPDKGIVRHHECGGLTLVRFDPAKDAGKPFSYTCSGCFKHVQEDRLNVEIMPPPELKFFGDESVAGNHVLYGILVLFSAYVEEVSKQIQHILDQATSIKNSRFHCRELFHKSKRDKTIWKPLTTAQLWKLAVEVVEVIKSNRGMFCLGIAYKDTFPNEVPGSPGVKLITDHLYPTAFSAALVGLHEHGLLDDDVQKQITIDKLRSKLTFWGVGGAQVQRLLNNNRLEVKIAEDNKPILLDVVDIILYSVGLCLRGNAPPEAQYIVDLVQPVERHGRWEPNAPDSPHRVEFKNGVPILFT